jgi:hypothetical protein
MDELQEQLERGKQAEDFLKYTQEHPYFNGLLERVKLEYARSLLEADPFASEILLKRRVQMMAIDDVMEAIRGDIYLGGEALKRLNGETEEPKGLL